jgi:type I restriction enzyme S subunit
MLLEPGDIYVSLKDVTQSADLLGAVSRVPEDIHQGRLTQDTVKLTFKTKNAPKDYIYWSLRTPQYREYCRAHATGTTNLGLPREDFLSFPIPALTSVRADLVALLQALDDKIDLNRRMNQTLEAMARAVFKDWFVDFDPTRAKMEGHVAYLVPEIWALFPDRLDDEGRVADWQSYRHR